MEAVVAMVAVDRLGVAVTEVGGGMAGGGVGWKAASAGKGAGAGTHSERVAAEVAVAAAGAATVAAVAEAMAEEAVGVKVGTGGRSSRFCQVDSPIGRWCPAAAPAEANASDSEYCMRLAG